MLSRHHSAICWTKYQVANRIFTYSQRHDLIGDEEEEQVEVRDNVQEG